MKGKRILEGTRKKKKKKNKRKTYTGNQLGTAAKRTEKLG
jgi:hypothetical protein